MHLEIVTNAIPGISDGEGVLRDIARWMAEDLGKDVPWHVTRFHPARDLGSIPPTSVVALGRAVEIGMEEGLRFVYVGNLWGHRAESTWCPGCGSPVIQRSGLQILDVQMDDGRCRVCSHEIPMTGDPRVSHGGSDGPVRVL
jgi:pyruvate formate lyase activating enzyme